MVNNKYSLTTIKVLGGFLVGLCLFTLSTGRVLAWKTATDGEAEKCPVGFKSVPTMWCCQEGSVVKRGGVLGFYCDGLGGEALGTASKAHLMRPGYCAANRVILLGAGFFSTNVCVRPGTLIEDSVEGSIYGKYFIKCYRFEQYNGTKGTAMISDIGYQACTVNDAIFLKDKTSCACKQGAGYIEVSLGDDESCEDVCGGEVLYDPAEGDLESNPSVSCRIAGDPANPKEWTGVVTALGCIPTEQTGITNWIMKFGFFISGALVVFRIIQGSIMIMTAIGNPDKIQEGKAVITSAIIGLMVILGAVMLLQFMGVDFLGLDIAGLN